MAGSKRIRHSARFGARYGVSVRKRFDEVENKQRVDHECPYCGFAKVKRVSTGIFACNKCGSKYAGGAFYPQTLTGGIIFKMVQQRSFSLKAAQALLGVEDEPVAPTTHISTVVSEEPVSDEERIEQLTHASEGKRKKKAAIQMDEAPQDEAPESA